MFALPLQLVLTPGTRIGSCSSCTSSAPPSPITKKNRPLGSSRNIRATFAANACACPVSSPNATTTDRPYSAPAARSEGSDQSSTSPWRYCRLIECLLFAAGSGIADDRGGVDEF